MPSSTDLGDNGSGAEIKGELDCWCHWNFRLVSDTTCPGVKSTIAKGNHLLARSTWCKAIPPNYQDAQWSFRIPLHAFLLVLCRANIPTNSGCPKPPGFNRVIYWQCLGRVKKCWRAPTEPTASALETLTAWTSHSPWKVWIWKGDFLSILSSKYHCPLLEWAKTLERAKHVMNLLMLESYCHQFILLAPDGLHPLHSLSQQEPCSKGIKWTDDTRSTIESAAVV